MTLCWGTWEGWELVTLVAYNKLFVSTALSALTLREVASGGVLRVE